MSVKIKAVTGRAAVLLCLLYLAWNAARLLKPLPQFMLYFGDYDQTGKVSVFTYHDYGTEYICSTKGSEFCADISFNGKVYALSFELREDEKQAADIKIDGEIVSKRNIHRVDQLVGETVYKNTTIINANDYPLEFWVYTTGMFVFFSALWLCLERRGGINSKCWWIYSDSSVKAIGRRGIWLPFLVSVITIGIHYGSDAGALFGTINLQQSGVDIYQLQSSMNAYLDTNLLMWPYNFIMLVFYDLAMTLNRVFLLFYDAAGYHFAEAVLIKVLNTGLLSLTILGILSFLLDERLIEERQAKTIYYWSVFHPLTYWIAVVYIQLDAFPVYCITLGFLLLNKCHKMWMISAVMIAAGVSAKSQELLVMPVVLLTAVTLYMAKAFVFETLSKRIFALAKYMGTLGGMLILFLGIFYVKQEAFYNVAAHTPQTERVWWTVLIYAPAVILFITVAGLVLSALLGAFSYHLDMSRPSLIVRGLYYCGMVILIFSFGILSTPGTCLNSLGAFVLLYSFAKDHYQRLIYAAGSILIAFSEIFSSIGDITAGLLFIGRMPIFTLLEQRLSQTGAGTRYTSLLFTIAHAAMLAYAILFYKKAESHADETSIRIGRME